MRYDKKIIMSNAHKYFRSGRYGTFANCLRLAWADAKTVAHLRDTFGEIHTYMGWQDFGREITHEEHAVVKVDLVDPTTKRGFRLTPFFTYEQTCELGSQDDKVA